MLSHIIKTRRSISSFTAEKVSPELIDEIISISAYAPSSCNTQPWFFLIFSTDESKKKLHSYVHRWYDYTKWDLKKNHRLFGNVYVKLLDFFSQYGEFNEAPVLVLLFAKPYDTPLFSQAIKFTKNEQIEKIADDSVKTSCAMAMQNFLLIAHEKGLWTRVKDGIKFLINFKELKDEFYGEFDIPKEYQLISGIQLGYPTQEALNRNTQERLPIEKVRRII